MSKIIVVVIALVLVMAPPKPIAAYPAHSVNPVKECYCPVLYQPVCASNNVTYQNMCVFECARERLADMHLVPITQGEPCTNSQHYYSLD